MFSEKYFKLAEFGHESLTWDDLRWPRWLGQVPRILSLFLSFKMAISDRNHEIHEEIQVERMILAWSRLKIKNERFWEFTQMKYRDGLWRTRKNSRGQSISLNSRVLFKKTAKKAYFRVGFRTSLLSGTFKQNPLLPNVICYYTAPDGVLDQSILDQI